MDAFSFCKNAITAFYACQIIQSVEVRLLDEPVAKIKAVVNNDIFIDIFYNAETERCSFALIKNSERIFGVDNAKFWHIHPFEDPSTHKKIEPLSLTDFLNTILLNKDKLIR